MASDYNNFNLGDFGQSGGDNLVHAAVKADETRGTVELFGREITVGREMAYLANSLIAQAETWVTQEGGEYARRAGVRTAQAFKANTRHAALAGQGAELALRYGLPVFNVALNVKNAVGRSMTRMNELSEEASALFRANEDGKGGVGKVLTTRNRVLTNERKLILSESRRTVLSSVANIVSSVPTIIMNRWKQQLNEIDNPSIVADRLPDHPTPEQLQRHREKMEKLEAMAQPHSQETIEKTQRDPIVSTVNRVLKPKNADDLDANLRLFAIKAPLIGGIVGRWISSGIDKNVGEQQSAWRRIKQLESALGEQDVESGTQIASTVAAIFQQYVVDCGSQQKLGGAKFKHLVEEVSNAIVEDKLNPQALAEILDNKKLFDFSGGSLHYGNTADTKEALESLTARYAKANTKAFYEHADFKPADAAKAFKNASAEERQILAFVFDPETLEAAGVPKLDVTQARQDGSASAFEHVSEMVNNMLEAGAADLRKHGVSEKNIKNLEFIAKDFNDAKNKGRDEDYMARNQEDMKSVVRNIVVTAKDPKGLWQDYLVNRANGRSGPRGGAERGDEVYAGR